MGKQVFESAHDIDDTVVWVHDGTTGNSPRLGAKIVAVTFKPGKVTYDIEFFGGGETLRNVDSCFVEGI